MTRKEKCSKNVWMLVLIQSFPQTVSEECCTLLALKKKRENGCLFTIIAYVLNASRTYKLKNAFGNLKCVFNNILFSTLHFFEAGGNSVGFITINSTSE